MSTYGNNLTILRVVRFWKIIRDTPNSTRFRDITVPKYYRK